MNILTDILSLIRRRQYVTQALPEDVIVLGVHTEPEIEGIASPVPYKNVKLIKIKDFVEQNECLPINVPIGALSSAGVFRDKTTDPDTNECYINFRRLKSLSLNLIINESVDNNFIEFNCLAELNTASNVGAGAGCFKQKTGEDFEFKSLTSTDGSVTITDDVNTIDLSSRAGSTAVITDGITITGDGTSANPLIATSNQSAGNSLISGGASYSEIGLVFDISVLVYSISGIQYTSAATSLTLNGGDPTYARFDAIVVDENLSVSVVQGVAAQTPLTPAINSDQVLVQFVLVGVNATSPTINTEFIYRDDATGPDWIGAVSAGNTADFSSTTPVPFQGTKCTLATIGRYGARKGVNFSTGTPVDRSEYVVLSFRINLPASLVDADISYFRIFAYGDNSSTAGYLGWVEAGNYIDFSLINTWQLVTIPTALFGSNPGTVDTIGYLNFSLYRCCSTTLSPTVQIALDDIKLQTGYGPQLNVATIDVMNEGQVVGSANKFDFRSATGLTTKTVFSTTTGVVKISTNLPASITEEKIIIPWVIDVTDIGMAQISAQAATPLVIGAPINALRDGQQLILKIKDDGFSKVLTWDSIWTLFNTTAGAAVTLPSATLPSKWLYITAYYDLISGNWHVTDAKVEA